MKKAESVTTAKPMQQAVGTVLDGERASQHPPKLTRRCPLPAIGGFDADVCETDVFTSQLWAQQVEAGPNVCVYIAGNEMWRAYAPARHPPIFKIGLSSPQRLFIRARELTRDAYGAFHKRDDDIVRDPQFGEWGIIPLDDEIALSRNSPVTINRRDIGIRLPASMRFQEFDRALRRALEPACLATWAESDEGRAYCAAEQLQLDRFHRFTVYPFGSGTRVSKATELTIFRPRQETRRLALIIESVLASVVCGH